jgi:hypothetical protein
MSPVLAVMMSAGVPSVFALFRNVCASKARRCVVGSSEMTPAWPNHFYRGSMERARLPLHTGKKQCISAPTMELYGPIGD